MVVCQARAYLLWKSDEFKLSIFARRRAHAAAHFIANTGNLSGASDAMLKAKGARAQLADGCFDGQQVAVARRTVKAAAGIDDGQNNLMLGDQGFERQSQRSQKLQAGVIEPAKIIGIKDDAGSVGISPLNPVLDGVCWHCWLSFVEWR